MFHFDFCYKMEGEADMTYVLIIKEDHYGFVQIHSCKTKIADDTATALLVWHRKFGTVNKWVSDEGTHFTNEVVEGPEQQTKAISTCITVGGVK